MLSPLAHGVPIGGENGYSVLEVTVALAIFASVLVPAIGGAVHVMTVGGAQTDVQALAEARRVMESTLQRRRFRRRTWLSGDGRWAFQREIRRREDRVTIVVRVWRARGRVGPQAATQPPPLIQLATTRLSSE
jgi:type II secretory pathway component PulJ